MTGVSRHLVNLNFVRIILSVNVVRIMCYESGVCHIISSLLLITIFSLSQCY